MAIESSIKITYSTAKAQKSLDLRHSLCIPADQLLLVQVLSFGFSPLRKLAVHSEMLSQMEPLFAFFAEKHSASGWIDFQHPEPATSIGYFYVFCWCRWLFV